MRIAFPQSLPVYSCYCLSPFPITFLSPFLLVRFLVCRPLPSSPSRPPSFHPLQVDRLMELHFKYLEAVQQADKRIEGEKHVSLDVFLFPQPSHITCPLPPSLPGAVYVFSARCFKFGTTHWFKRVDQFSSRRYWETSSCRKLRHVEQPGVRVCTASGWGRPKASPCFILHAGQPCFSI